ncbi:SMI1/KNR4 family protein [Alkalinema sp. FACHB-956]|uniref:SMI1/KNR4 family protein n=1 Tax=Alkalinema sp. FACHB-956 TaxID=2692768 RepID=UPI0016860E11|nr:SMI1/KNR4 family protein [Alkalinema sp. FACHB-956]MBD2326000.1 SMI1/KNR4 family protein [Alkalinema sp. FACHB-956]
MNQYSQKLGELAIYWLYEDAKTVKIEDIFALEKIIQHQLPQDYTEFLMNYNVIAFDNYVEFPLIEECFGEDWKSIDLFWGIVYDEARDIGHQYINNYKDRLPNGLLPIASDAGDNIICIGIAEDIKGEIYFWDFEEELHDPDDEDLEDPFYNTCLVAHSFSEFINSMRIEEELD